MRKGFTLIELMIVIAIIAIIAAIAIPNLLESRLTANEAAASASLKSGVMPSQIQFQAGGYQDVDADNVGEYGTLGALAGVIPTTKIALGQIKLLQGPLAAGAGTLTTRTANGYSFVAMVPWETTSGGGAVNTFVEGDAMNTAALTVNTNTANNGERYYAVGCAPEKFSDTGRRVFILSHDGQIRSPTTAANLNQWFGNVAPSSGQSPTAAHILNGMANAFDAANTVPAAFAVTINMGASMNTNYPTYAR